jgi:hypothetical protein
MGWDEPVNDPAVYLPHDGRALSGQPDRTRVTGGISGNANAFRKTTQ